MSDHGASTFGKDNGLVQEAIITGRKLGAGRGFWSKLAHGESFFKEIMGVYEGTHEIVPKRELPLFLPFEAVTIKAVSAHKTSVCFKSKESGVQYWRDGELDESTPQDRLAHEGGRYVAQKMSRRAEHRQMAAVILGVDVEVGDAELQRLIIEHGHCVEMLQIEDLIERIEAGEEGTGLAKDGKDTFFFVDNGEGTVLVVRASWYSGYGAWRVHISQFGTGFEWFAGSRVLSRSQIL